MYVFFFSSASNQRTQTMYWCRCIAISALKTTGVEKWKYFSICVNQLANEIMVFRFLHHFISNASNNNNNKKINKIAKYCMCSVHPFSPRPIISISIIQRLSLKSICIQHSMNNQNNCRTWKMNTHKKTRLALILNCWIEKKNPIEQISRFESKCWIFTIP